MPQLAISELLQSLSYALIQSVWQYALLWLAIRLLLPFMRAANERYWILMASHWSGFMWFICTFLQYPFGQGIAETTILPLNIAAFGSSNVQPFFTAAALLYLVGVGWLSLKAVVGLRQVRGMKAMTGTQKAPWQWRVYVNQTAEHLGLNRLVQIRISSRIQSPVTFGFLKPIILIPVSAVNNLSPAQMEAVILHELAHIKRHDYLLNLVQVALDTAMFFNPFARLISKEIRKERENACDDFVLQFQYKPAEYASALLKLAHSAVIPTPALAMSASKGLQELTGRIHRMVELPHPPKKEVYRKKLAVVLVTLAIVSFISEPFIQSKKATGSLTDVRREIQPVPLLVSDGFSSEKTNTAYQPLVKPINLASTAKNNTAATISGFPDETVFSQVHQSDGIPSFVIPAVQREEEGLSPQLILQDFAASVESAIASGKKLDPITVKSMLLAKLRQSMAEDNGRSGDEHHQLDLLEKKVAGDLITSVIQSSTSSVSHRGNDIVIEYELPEDGSGKSYVFQYIFRQPSQPESGDSSTRAALDTMPTQKVTPKVPIRI